MITVYLLLMLILILVSRFLTALVKSSSRRLILRKIPSPPGHWLWGNLSSDMWYDADQLFRLFRQYAKDYWPIYRFEAFGVTTVNLLHPNDIEIVLSNMVHMKKSNIYNLLGKWLGKGLVTSTGKKWQTRRKLLTPAFHFTILKKFLLVFNEETEKLVDRIEENCDAPYIDVVPFITQMTLQSIGETAMGMSEINPHAQEKYKASLHRLIKLIINKLTSPWYLLPYVNKFSKHYKEETEMTEYLHDFAYQVIRSREKQLLNEYGNRDDYVSYPRKIAARMLDILIMSKMKGDDIDLEGIREEVDTFMFAGHDTTTTGITYLLLILANHQNIQEAVRQEINDVIGSGVPTYENLQQLKYTERVIKESLRFLPVVPFISRVAGEDFTTFTGYYIPKGTILHIHIYDLHQNSRIYPDPLKFDPDRFLPEHSPRNPFAYIPFSAGPRNCIGQKFAILELKSVLCGILRRFTLHEIDRPRDISFYLDLVLRPKTAIRIKFVPK